MTMMQNAPSTEARRNEANRLQTINETIVASYKSHNDAEDAVRRLADSGLPVDKISIIGRDFQVREDIQGFYRPADIALAGAGQGAWFGGLFGLLMGMGFFVVPIAGALFVLGPLAGLIAGAIGGAGVGALISALVAVGIPQDQAIKYQERLQAGEFLVVVHGGADQTELARTILQDTTQTHLQIHAMNV